jgi:hypothetical protein
LGVIRPLDPSDGNKRSRVQENRRNFLLSS